MLEDAEKGLPNQAETLARALGGEALLDLVVEQSHSCYLGDRSTRHPWGYGCGGCPACELRERGWQAYRMSLAPGARAAG